jgi:hypothetical protein
MKLFRRKPEQKPEDEVIDDSTTDENKDDSSADDGNVSRSVRSDVVEIPDAVQKALDKIEQEQPAPDMVEVEVDDDGNEIKTDAKDGEVTGSEEEIVDDGHSEDSSDDDSPETEVDDGQSGYVEIDPRLVAAGRAMKWSDTKIRNIAGTDESILSDIADRLEEAAPHRDDKEEEAPVKDDKKPAELSEDTIKKLREDYGDDYVDNFVLPKMKEDARLKDLESKLGKVDEFDKNQKAEAEEKKIRYQSSVADSVFDSHAKQFEEIGLTKNIKRYPDGSPVDTPQMKVRSQIYNVAVMFHNSGMPFEQAMSEAMTWYSGQTKDVRLQRKLVKDVKAQKGKFTQRPTQRKFKKVFKDTNAKRADIVGEAMKKAGIK